METPNYMKVTTVSKPNGQQLYANIKIKRWGWGWLAFTETKPTRWRNTPVWFLSCLGIAIKGLVGALDE